MNTESKRQSSDDGDKVSISASTPRRLPRDTGTGVQGLPMPWSTSMTSPPLQSQYVVNDAGNITVTKGFSGRLVADLVPNRPLPLPNPTRTPRISVGASLYGSISPKGREDGIGKTSERGVDGKPHSSVPSQGNLSPSRPTKEGKKSPKLESHLGSEASFSPPLVTNAGGSHRDGSAIQALQQTRQQCQDSLPPPDSTCVTKSPRGETTQPALPVQAHDSNPVSLLPATAASRIIVDGTSKSLQSVTPSALFDMDAAAPPLPDPSPSELTNAGLMLPTRSSTPSRHISFPAPRSVYPTPLANRIIKNSGGIERTTLHGPQTVATPAQDDVTASKPRKRVSSRQSSKSKQPPNDSNDQNIANVPLDSAVSGSVATSSNITPANQSPPLSIAPVPNKLEGSSLSSSLQMSRGYIVLLCTIQALVAMFACVAVAAVVLEQPNFKSPATILVTFALSIILALLSGLTIAARILLPGYFPGIRLTACQRFATASVLVTLTTATLLTSFAVLAHTIDCSALDPVNVRCRIHGRPVNDALIINKSMSWIVKFASLLVFCCQALIAFVTMVCSCWTASASCCIQPSSPYSKGPQCV